jgi:hypothetical protein
MKETSKGIDSRQRQVRWLRGALAPLVLLAVTVGSGATWVRQR